MEFGTCDGDGVHFVIRDDDAFWILVGVELAVYREAGARVRGGDQCRPVLQRKHDGCQPAGATAQRQEAGRGSVCQLYFRYHPLHESSQELRLSSASDYWRQFRFSDPAFIANVGKIAQGVLDRSAWEKGKPGSTTAKINDMFKAKTGYDLDDTSARNMQALFVLADAINRAGSTRPEAIQQALQQTDLKPEQLMMGYRGVKFDSTGQNALAATYLIQLQGTSYVVVWPERSATAKLIYPFEGWQ